MNILIFSDSHRHTDDMILTVSHTKNVSMIIHCGDVADDIDDLKLCFPHINVCGVRGNNDFFANEYPLSCIRKTGRFSAFITHGHMYSARRGTEKLAASTKAANCDICIYGHTHIPLLRRDGDIILINPGAVITGTYALYDTDSGVISLKNLSGGDIKECLHLSQ